jgi:hypothetical protein
MNDLLLALKAQLDNAARARMQHLRPEYLAHEAARLAAYAATEDTRRQLAKYGVNV